MELDEFPDLPLILDERAMTVTGRMVATRIDLSSIALKAGDRLDAYLRGLDQLTQSSHFRWQCQWEVNAIEPTALVVDLARIHWSQVDFCETNFSGSRIEEASIWLTDCRVDRGLPAITIERGSPYVYPPGKATRELNLTDVRAQLVLRWGLCGRGSNLAQALLWLESRHPTRPLLQKLLKPGDRHRSTIGRSSPD